MAEVVMPCVHESGPWDYEIFTEDWGSSADRCLTVKLYQAPSDFDFNDPDDVEPDEDGDVLVQSLFMDVSRMLSGLGEERNLPKGVHVCANSHSEDGATYVAVSGLYRRVYVSLVFILDRLAPDRAASVRAKIPRRVKPVAAADRFRYIKPE